MNWLDILIVIIVGWYAWIGLRAGLVGGLARLLGAFLGLAAAFNFYRPLADTVNLKWNLVSYIGKWIPVPALGSWVNMPGPANLLPAQGVPGPESQVLAPKGSLYVLQGLGESLSRVLASGILDILCFILIFIVVSRLVVLLGALLGKIGSLLFLGPVDRFGGLLLGAAKGIVIAAVLVALLNAVQLPAVFFSGGRSSNWISLALQKSLIAPHFIKALVIFNVKFPGWSI